MSILQQRLGLPEDTPLEFVNGGHGIKNPLAPNPEVPRSEGPEKMQQPPGTPEESFFNGSTSRNLTSSNISSKFLFLFIIIALKLFNND